MKKILKFIGRLIFLPIRLLRHGRINAIPETAYRHIGGVQSIDMRNDIFLSEVRRVLEEGHTATIRVKGFSMRPFLEHCRDKVVLRQATDFKVGDAILAEIQPGLYVLHRLIRWEGQDLTLMGDGNVRGVEHCHPENVAGVVKTFIRREKPIEATSWKWRYYSAVWPRLLPIRRYLLFIYRQIF